MSCGIYALRAIDGAIKVGRSSQFEIRRVQLTLAHGPLETLCFIAAPPTALVALEAYAHSAMRWWRRRGEWYEPTRWARQLVSEWAAAGELFCPPWLHWLDLETREPLPDWRERPFTEPTRPLAVIERLKVRH
jgi:hypothetical protein